jgi:hypothetical protein
LNGFFDLLKDLGVSCVYEVWEWRSEIVDISGKNIYKFIGRVGGQNRSKVAPGETKIGPRGAPRKFRKTGRQQNAPVRETIMQMAPKWAPTSQGWLYFG